MRPRKTDRHLPACVYLRNGGYYYVKRNQWRPLGRDLATALHEYARIVAQPTDGMPALIDSAMPAIYERVTPSTRKHYEVCARRLREMFAEFQPDQVRRADIVLMLDVFRDRPSVGNRMLSVLSSVFAWALERGKVETNPCANASRLRVEARQRLVTPGEYAAIRQHAGARLRVIMDLCFLTGQRIGDVLTIRRADLGVDGIAFTQQKTGKRLIVEWSPELRAAVDDAKRLTGNLAPLTLFYSRGGKPPAHQNVWRAFKAAAAKAGVVDVTLHDLRAMAGTAIDAQGGSAKGLLGHSSDRTTKIYLRDKAPKVVAGPRFDSGGTAKKGKNGKNGKAA